MKDTMSQLESEFKVDIMILSDDIESNSKDEKILKEIDNQVDIGDKSARKTKTM
jgi:hypothetical protein